ncbi:uncharacterized protein B0H64DRAFT_179341 [Chaetomium fimeti]|uniref:Uncharacterized protein n=1 Tax=Chaetomium fimeti TaxID=1854472 RepID=A0AAE0HEA3_9PEZI|nr:hypothetical protein B0H64DRAFT_179341 [Chaetomium fimeti]
MGIVMVWNCSQKTILATQPASPCPTRRGQIVRDHSKEPSARSVPITKQKRPGAGAKAACRWPLTYALKFRAKSVILSSDALCRHTPWRELNKAVPSAPSSILSASTALVRSPKLKPESLRGREDTLATQPFFRLRIAFGWVSQQREMPILSSPRKTNPLRTTPDICSLRTSQAFPRVDPRSEPALSLQRVREVCLRRPHHTFVSMPSMSSAVLG